MPSTIFLGPGTMDFIIALSAPFGAVICAVIAADIPGIDDLDDIADMLSRYAWRRRAAFIPPMTPDRRACSSRTSLLSLSVRAPSFLPHPAISGSTATMSAEKA